MVLFPSNVNYAIATQRKDPRRDKRAMSTKQNLPQKFYPLKSTGEITVVPNPTSHDQGFFPQPVTPNRTPVPVNRTGLTGYR